MNHQIFERKLRFSSEEHVCLSIIKQPLTSVFSFTDEQLWNLGLLFLSKRKGSWNTLNYWSWCTLGFEQRKAIDGKRSRYTLCALSPVHRFLFVFIIWIQWRFRVHPFFSLFLCHCVKEKERKLHCILKFFELKVLSNANLISNQVRLPAELKHISKRRKRN